MPVGSSGRISEMQHRKKCFLVSGDPNVCYRNLRFEFFFVNKVVYEWCGWYETRQIHIITILD
jgi:hypothetical protein